MKLSTKVLIWAWIILLSVVGSLVYSAYSKLSPDSLISLLNDQVKKNYPGSHLTIAKVDYGFSLDFNLSLKTLTLTRGEKTLASANKLELKVPWWLILLNRGNAQVNISDLVIFVVTDLRSNLQNVPVKFPTAASEKIELKLPKYLIDARYTLRAKNISVIEIDGDRRLFTLSKLLVRELQFGKNSAFELNIPISITHKDKNFSSDLWLFGDVTPSPDSWTLNYRGEFKTKDSQDGFELDDLIIDGRSVFSVSALNLSSFVDLSIDRQKVGTGEITAKDNEVQISLSFFKFPLEYLKVFGEEIKNPFLKKLSGHAQGEINFKHDFLLDSSATLSAKLHFPGQFYFDKDLPIDGKWFLGFENEKWETSFVSPKGEVNFHRRAVLDFSKGAVTQFSQEIGFTGLDMSLALKTVDAFPAILAGESNTYFSSFISLKKCLEGDKEVDGTFRYGRSPYETFYQGEILQDKSKMNLNYLGRTDIKKLTIDMNQFLWNPSYQFLEPVFAATQGILNGKIEGAWYAHWSDGKWLFKLQADQLKEEKGEFLGLNQQLWRHFTLDPLPVMTKSWDVVVKDPVVKLNSIVLNGVDPAMITGHLTTSASSKSYLILTHPENKKWKPVRKDVTDVFWKKENP